MDDHRGKKFQIVTDAQYPCMYRVRTPDGRLSDMTNLTRAREIARVLNEKLAEVSTRGVA